jgi:3-deoxy-manno-octulosonate cytidylyltransferase (CMP-KDO synthetase)
MKVLAVIPARYDSSRFPGKPLALLQGKFLIQQVYERVKASCLFEEVIVATDSDKILAAVNEFHGTVEMTSTDHKSGTDRVAEVCRKRDFDIVINVQGDEPFIDTQALKKLLECFQEPAVKVASLMHPLSDDLENPNIVKVVTDTDNYALYFSRSVIPYNRDNSAYRYYHHIGVYAFRRDALLDYVSLPSGKLEIIEKLEQLRLLENGRKIKMVETDYQGFGIDTKADLFKAEQIFNQI